MTPAATLRALDRLHKRYSLASAKTIHAFADGARNGPERDRLRASETVIFLFHRAVSRQIGRK